MIPGRLLSLLLDSQTTLEKSIPHSAPSGHPSLLDMMSIGGIGFASVMPTDPVLHYTHGETRGTCNE